MPYNISTLSADSLDLYQSEKSGIVAHWKTGWRKLFLIGSLERLQIRVLLTLLYNRMRIFSDRVELK